MRTRRTNNGFGFRRWYEVNVTNVFTDTTLPIADEEWALSPEDFIWPNGFLVAAGMHPMYPRVVVGLNVSEKS